MNYSVVLGQYIISCQVYVFVYLCLHQCVISYIVPVHNTAFLSAPDREISVTTIYRYWSVHTHYIDIKQIHAVQGITVFFNLYTVNTAYRGRLYRDVSRYRLLSAPDRGVSVTARYRYWPVHTGIHVYTHHTCCLVTLTPRSSIGSR